MCLKNPILPNFFSGMINSVLYYPRAFVTVHPFHLICGQGSDPTLKKIAVRGSFGQSNSLWARQNQDYRPNQKRETLRVANFINF